MAKKKAPAVKSGGLCSLANLTPVTRMETILNGGDISPVTREEYFVKKAVTTASSELPAVTSDDNGDVLSVVNGAWSKAEAPSGLPDYTESDIGKALMVGSVPVATTLVDETVTLDEETHEGPLSDPSALASLSEGDSVVFTLGEKTVTLTVENNDGELFISDDGDGIYWKINPAESYAYAFDYNAVGDTIHVKLETSEQETAVEWDSLTIDKAPFVVHFTESGGNWSADKTFAEILTNFDEHGVPVNIVLFAVYDEYMPAYSNSSRQAVTGSTFFLNAGANTITITSVAVGSNSVVVEEHDYTLTPSV